MTKYLQFYFNLHDPEASSKTLVVNDSDTEYILSTTGKYFGKTGVVSLIAKADGRRDVTIGFNYN